MEFYLLVGAVMFFAGVYGFITRRNLLAMLVSLELILNAVNVNFVVFNRFLYPEALEGFFFTLFVIGVAAGETAVRSPSSSTCTATSRASRRTVWTR